MSEAFPSPTPGPRQLRASGREALPRPQVVHAKDPKLEGGAEAALFDVRLHYDDKVVNGLVFKRFKKSADSPDVTNRERLTNILSQWQRLRDVRAELSRRKKPGFDLPGTIRGISTEEGEGLLVSDLSENDTNELTDVKMLRLHPEQWSPSEWRTIKKAILRDLAIARKHNIKLVSGGGGLDPWLVVRNKETGQLRIVISDIGLYTSTTLDPNLSYDGRLANNPDYLYQKGVKSIKALERDLKLRWEGLKRRKALGLP